MSDGENSSSPLRLSRKRKILYSIAVGAAAAIAVFSAGEIYFRHWWPIDKGGWYELTGDPILFYRLTPSRTGEEHGQRRTQTAQGIRGPWVFEERPPPGVRRVLWVGDSACFGTGCADEQTAAYRFHEIASAAGAAVESINLGVVGYNVRQVREVLERRLSEFRGADAIIYYHHENDIVNAPWAALAPKLPGGLYWEYEAPQSLVKKIVKRSAVVRRLWNTDLLTRLRATHASDSSAAAIRDALADRSIKLPIHPFTLTCVGLYSDGNDYGRRFRGELYGMADLAASIDARMVMVYWPSRTLLHNPELANLRGTFSSWCDTKGIGFVDLTDAFVASVHPALYFDAIHPGPGGQQAIAEAVFKGLFGGQSNMPEAARTD